MRRQRLEVAMLTVVILARKNHEAFFTSQWRPRRERRVCRWRGWSRRSRSTRSALMMLFGRSQRIRLFCRALRVAPLFARNGGLGLPQRNPGITVKQAR
jgi:hypothetical protein